MFRSVSSKHQYRKFNDLFDFSLAWQELKTVESCTNYKGFGVLHLFKSLFLQFLENLSDRELEKYLSDSNAAKWFCDFDLTESTPDYSVFSKLRAKIGTNLLSKIFSSFTRSTALARLYKQCVYFR
jgi:transposase